MTPKSARDGFDGMIRDDSGATRLRVRVRAVPDKGAANDAVCRLVAKALAVPVSDVALVSGHTGRNKALVVSGDPAELVSRLEALLTPA